MDLILSDDQRSIVSSVANVLDDLMPIEQVRKVLDGDAAPLDALWRAAAELGWFGLGLPEELGGAGFDLIDEALLFVELGRRITPGPFLATVLAARVAAIGNARDIAERLLTGEARAGLRIRPGDGSSLLIGGVGVDYLVDATLDAANLYPASNATNRVLIPGLDELTSRESAVIAGHGVAVFAEDDPIMLRGSVLVSAMLSGIAAAARDMSVSYAKTRDQFGSPIGAFQAVKHRCADMAVRAALADAQLTFAALSVSESTADAPFQVAALCTVAERAAMDNARETIQIHGGIGVTWECDAHLYLKRVHALRELFGEAAHGEDLLAVSEA